MNPSDTDPIAVTVTFRGEDGGVIVADTFSMGPLTHRSMTTTSAYPATVGKRGTIEISTTGSYMSVVALRFGPSAISSVPPLVASKWAVPDNAVWAAGITEKTTGTPLPPLSTCIPFAAAASLWGRIMSTIFPLILGPVHINVSCFTLGEP